MPKPLASFLRDWGYPNPQEEPQIAPFIVPTILLDDAEDFTTRYRPTYMGRTGIAATAAVYSYVGLMTGAWPIRVRQVTPYSITAGTNIFLRYAIADLRTANQASGTPSGLVRGQAVTASIVNGTSAVAPTGFGIYDANDAAIYSPEYRQNYLELRPGESLWLIGGAVNIAVFGAFVWEEVAIVPQPNPGDLS